MGVAEYIIIGIVFVALAGCFVYSIATNTKQ